MLNISKREENILNNYNFLKIFLKKKIGVIKFDIQTRKIVVYKSLIDYWKPSFAHDYATRGVVSKCV